MMEQITLQTGDSPVVLIHMVAGDLRLSGWGRPEFMAEGSDPEGLTAIFQNNQVTFESRSDASLRVPQNATVTVTRVAGGARVKSLAGDLQLDQVSGDLTLRKTGAVRVAQLSGDLSARKVDGDLTLESVTGDVSARGVQGGFAADQVAGDIYLRGLGGDARVSAAGDINLSLTVMPGHSYRFDAGGVLTCRIQPGASARVTLNAGGGISLQPGAGPGDDDAGIEDGQTRQFTLGDGEAELDLSAGGDLLLTTKSAAWDTRGEYFGDEFGAMAEEFSQRLEAEINARLADIDRHINAQISTAGIFGGPAAVDVDKITRKARRAAERARRKGERAMQRAGRKAARAQRTAGRSARRRAFTFRVNPRRKPPDDPVTDEERLSILRMVEQGTISVEQAEKLLAALEGRA